MTEQYIITINNKPYNPPDKKKGEKQMWFSSIEGAKRYIARHGLTKAIVRIRNG